MNSRTVLLSTLLCFNMTAVLAETSNPSTATAESKQEVCKIKHYTNSNSIIEVLDDAKRDFTISNYQQICKLLETHQAQLCISGQKSNLLNNKAFSWVNVSVGDQYSNLCSSYAAGAYTTVFTRKTDKLKLKRQHYNDIMTAIEGMNIPKALKGLDYYRNELKNSP